MRRLNYALKRAMERNQLSYDEVMPGMNKQLDEV
jgi:hypothetical protein